MTRFLVIALLTAITALGIEVPSPSTSSNDLSLVTFNKNVLTILQKNCQVCHRPGGAAPMSFMTYESTRPWARAIREAVLSKKMPPWFADPHIGEFRNAPQMKEIDIATLAAWADSGAPEGNAADKPQDIRWAEGWRTQPDVVVSMTEPYRVAAKGSGEIKQFFIENPFKEDTWVSSIEIRPGDPSVVHHVIVQVPEQQAETIKLSIACKDCKEGQEAVSVQRTIKEVQEAAVSIQRTLFVAGFNAFGTRLNGQPGGTYSDIIARLRERETGRGSFTTMEAVYAPGSQPQDFRYPDTAKLVPGGRPIRLEVHYTPNGKETTDVTRVGFTLSKAPAQRRFVIMAPEHMVDSRKPIPAGDANYETLGVLRFTEDAELVWFMPHMHLRGKDMSFRLVSPDGRDETVLSAKFNFNWQLGYEVEKPIKVPKDTRMIVTAHHDNSANNPMNPSPGQQVQWGEMTTLEMMLPWFGVIVDKAVTPDMIAVYTPPDLDSIPNLKFSVDGVQPAPK